MSSYEGLNTTGYPYAKDCGINSVQALTELVRSSGVDFRVGSGYRPGDPQWHGKGNAIDVFATNKDMVEISAYLYQFSPFILQLEHVNPNGTGYWVSRGIRVGKDYFGPRQYEAHKNHIHLAGTNSAMHAAAEWVANGKKGIPFRDETKQTGGGTPGSSLGCLTGSATTALILASPLLYIVTR